MPLIQNSDQIIDIEDDKEKFRFIQLWMQDASSVINGRVEFSSNIQSNLKSVVFAAANTDTTVAHGLAFPPNGYIVAGLSANMVIYDGALASTSSKITLKSSAVGTARLIFL